MIITNAQWTDGDKNTIAATIDGELMWVPVDPKNRHFTEIQLQGIAIAAPDNEGEV